MTSASGESWLAAALLARSNDKATSLVALFSVSLLAQPLVEPQARLWLAERPRNREMP